MTSLFSAMKKTVGSPRKPTANGHANDSDEVKVPVRYRGYRAPINQPYSGGTKSKLNQIS